MKRDASLIRNILERIEAHPEPDIPKSEIDVGARAAVVGYHLELCEEARLVRWNPDDPRLVALTGKGHDFLRQCRLDDDID